MEAFQNQVNVHLLSNQPDSAGGKAVTPGLNSLIRDGWELVSTHVGQNAWYSLGCGHSMSQMNFVLRRPAA